MRDYSKLTRTQRKKLAEILEESGGEQFHRVNKRLKGGGKIGGAWVDKEYDLLLSQKMLARFVGGDLSINEIKKLKTPKGRISVHYSRRE